MSAARRVLVVSPHFPPDSSAAAHRARLLAPHLAAHGWEPTVVAVDPRDCEGRLEPALLELVPPSLEVRRVRAFRRRLGVGDLGLRAFVGLERACASLLAARRYDALYVTIYPAYPALLGPILKRRFGVPFVLDYQDPWVGEWGRGIGGGPGGRPDLKSRLSRALATRLEPIAVAAADAVTAVSAGTWRGVVERNPALAARPCLELPIGFEPADAAVATSRPRRPLPFAPDDGDFHLCAVGTVAPLFLETLEAIFSAARALRARDPRLGARLRLHFFGTSGQHGDLAGERVMPLARRLGVEDFVDEAPARLDYLDALALGARASALLLPGSSEPHYTASRIFPSLLAGRPILAVYHRASSGPEILARAAPASARVVTFDEAAPVATHVPAIADALAAMMSAASPSPAPVDLAAIADLSAPALAARLASLFDEVSAARRPPSTRGTPTP